MPILLFYFLFLFPPTRKLIGYFLRNKIQSMSQNGHVYYRSYHFGQGSPPFTRQAPFERQEKDVTPRNSQENLLE